MKTYKTPTKKRTTYKQYDDFGHELYELNPKKEGTTEVEVEEYKGIVKGIHLMEDAEVRVHIKETRVPAFIEEAAKAARDKYITDFEAKYGYKPKPGEYPDFTHRTFASLDDEVPTDSGEDTIGDHSRIAAQIASRPFDDAEETAAEYARETVMTNNKYTDRERQVYRLVYIEEMSKQDAAKELGISSARVTQIVKSIMGKLIEDAELNRKIHIYP